MSWWVVVQQAQIGVSIWDTVHSRLVGRWAMSGAGVQAPRHDVPGDNVAPLRWCSAGCMSVSRGGARHFHLGGNWRGQFCNKGAVNGLCRTFRKRPTPPLENFFGGQAKLGGQLRPSSAPGGQLRPLAPPLSARIGRCWCTLSIGVGRRHPVTIHKTSLMAGSMRWVWALGHQTRAQYFAVEWTRVGWLFAVLVLQHPQPESVSRLTSAMRDVNFLQSDSCCRRYVSSLSNIIPRYLGSEQKGRVSFSYCSQRNSLFLCTCCRNRRGLLYACCRNLGAGRIFSKGSQLWILPGVAKKIFPDSRGGQKWWNSILPLRNLEINVFLLKI